MRETPGVLVAVVGGQWRRLRYLFERIADTEPGAKLNVGRLTVEFPNGSKAMAIHEESAAIRLCGLSLHRGYIQYPIEDLMRIETLLQYQIRLGDDPRIEIT